MKVDWTVISHYINQSPLFFCICDCVQLWSTSTQTNQCVLELIRSPENVDVNELDTSEKVPYSSNCLALSEATNSSLTLSRSLMSVTRGTLTCAVCSGSLHVVQRLKMAGCWCWCCLWVLVLFWLQIFFVNVYWNFNPIFAALISCKSSPTWSRLKSKNKKKQKI